MKAIEVHTVAQENKQLGGSSALLLGGKYERETSFNRRLESSTTR